MHHRSVIVTASYAVWVLLQRPRPRSALVRNRHWAVFTETGFEYTWNAQNQNVLRIRTVSSFAVRCYILCIQCFYRIRFKWTAKTWLDFMNVQRLIWAFAARIFFFFFFFFFFFETVFLAAPRLHLDNPDTTPFVSHCQYEFRLLPGKLSLYHAVAILDRLLIATLLFCQLRGGASHNV